MVPLVEINAARICTFCLSLNVTINRFPLKYRQSDSEYTRTASVSAIMNSRDKCARRKLFDFSSRKIGTALGHFCNTLFILFTGTYGIRVKSCFAFDKINSSAQLIDEKGWVEEKVRDRGRGFFFVLWSVFLETQVYCPVPCHFRISFYPVCLGVPFSSTKSLYRCMQTIFSWIF